ncbi:MAG: hypothetical protein GXX08_03055 [Firmicutes bacterium]|jgi:hypothetical protein|nr:hypothetical protein [Bacillota bacterium]
MPFDLNRGRVRVGIIVWLVLVVIASLVPAQVQAGEAAINWRAIIDQYSGKKDLSTRERLELAIARGNVGDFFGSQREFEVLERAGWTKEAQAMRSESEARLVEDPDSLMDLNVVAFTSFVLQDYELSCTTFQRIVEVDEGNEWPRLFLAWTYGQLGMIDEGIAELEYVRRKHPFNIIVNALLLMAKAKR